MLFQKNLNHHSLNVFSLFCLASILASYFIYAPIIHIPTFHHDTYKYSSGGRHISCEQESGYNLSFQLARPMTAYLDCANFKLANTLEKISYMRAVTTLLIALLMGLFGYWLFCVGFPSIQAFLMSVAIFTLPIMHDAIILAATFLILPILMALLAYLLVQKGFASFPSNRLSSFIWYIAGLACLEITFFTYPATSGFFLVPTVILVLFTPLYDWQRTRKEIILHLIIFCFASVLYFLITRYVQAKMQIDVNSLPVAYRLNPNLNWLNRFESLVKVFPNLWNINFYIYPLQTYIFYFIVTFGAVLGLFRLCTSHFFQVNRKNSFVYLFQAIASLGALFILGSIAYIMQPINMVASRIIFVYQTMSVCLLIWSLWQISFLYKAKKEKLLLVMLSALCLFGMFITNYLTTRIVLSDDRELSFVTSSISSFSNHHQISRIHIIPAEHALERGQSSYYAGDIGYIVNAALHQMQQLEGLTINNCLFTEADEENHLQDEKKCIESAAKNVISVTYSRRGKPMYISPNTLIIDMNGMN